MWSSRPVFVSSTFQDMQAERDHLRNFVFPAIEERLNRRGRHLEWVDLRIGVATASLAGEGERELQVLKVCFDEVRRCRPFLIVLLGDRYGWVPPPDRVSAAAREAGFSGAAGGRSVTDLEIDLGVLQNADQQTRSFFYFRDPLPYAAMPRECVARYADADGDAAAPFGRRARDLQDRIARALPDRVRRYSAAWDARTQQVTGLETWGLQVVEDLWSEIESELAAAPSAPADPFEDAHAAQERFFEDASRDFVGRTALLARALTLAQGGNDPAGAWALCIEGPAGSGKSAFAGQLRRELAATGACVLVHGASAGLGSGSVDAMLRRWIAALAARIGADTSTLDVSTPDRVDQAFASLLARVSARERVVVLIDALDQFEVSTRGRFATWLPRDWPANARLIVTAIPCDASAALAERAGVERVSMPPLDAAEARAIFNGICARYHRTLDADVIDVVLSKSAASGPSRTSPLWVVLAAETLNLVDADDFADALRRNAGTPAEQLRAMLIARADELAPDVAGVYHAAFDRAQKVFGAEFAGAFLSLVAISRGGWRQTDFRDLLPTLTGSPWDELRFAQLRRFFRGQVRERGAFGQWDFAHGQMRDALFDHPVSSRLPTEQLHGEIARHLVALPAGDALRRTETMLHLLGAQDWDGAVHYYGGDLPEAELEGATEVLVGVALIPAEDETASGLAYLREMLKVTRDEPEYVEYGAQRVMYSVFERLRVRAPLDTQVRLGCALIATFDTLKLLFAFTRVGPHLAAAYDRVCDALFAQRKFDESEHFQIKGEETLRELAGLEPDRLEWQRDLAVGHNKRARIQQARGDLAGALATFKAGLDAIERVSNARPDDRQWKQDVAASHQYIGDLQLQLGDLDAARASFDASASIRRELAARPGIDLEAEFAIALSHGRRAGELRARGDLVSSETALATAVHLLDELVAINPSNLQWVHAAFAGMLDLGRLQEEQGRGADAERVYLDGLRHGKRLITHDPQHPGWLATFANAQGLLARLALKRISAEDAAEELLDVAESRLLDVAAALERLMQVTPADTTAKDQLAACYVSLKELRARRGDLAGAQTWHAKYVQLEKGQQV